MKTEVRCDRSDPSVRTTMDVFADQKGGVPVESRIDALVYDFPTDDQARQFGALISLAGVVDGVTFTPS